MFSLVLLSLEIGGFRLLPKWVNIADFDGMCVCLCGEYGDLLNLPANASVGPEVCRFMCFFSRVFSGAIQAY